MEIIKPLTSEKANLYVQFSSGQGPLECAFALTRILAIFEQAAQQAKITCELVKSQAHKDNEQYFSSALIHLVGDHLADFMAEWRGTICWKNASPFRPKHKRSKWFISIDTFSFESHNQIELAQLAQEVVIETMRSSGAGGQHVNKTNSAIRMTHPKSGMSVRIESQRSQHQNKKYALVLLYMKLQALNNQSQQNQDKSLWFAHQDIQRGNAIKTFIGNDFKLR